MCGIAGLLRRDNSSVLEEVRQMAKSLAHRGPDGEGFCSRPGLSFGHRRLAVIDLAGGVQPMVNESDSVWLTYNGELYNYIELRKELESLGHIFKTRSDTEVVLHAYEHWGEECLKRFRGMFAFAIADIAKGEILLARDHFGIKPLYYFFNGNTFAFASELQAFKNVDDFNPEIDLKSVDRFLWLQYIPAPYTIFKKVWKLKPAHYIKIKFNLEIGAQKKYWDLEFKADETISAGEWEQKVDDTFAESVRLHLASDVEFGAFLSGGIDSTLVTGYMSKFLSKPVLTFSIGFKEKEYNEAGYARIVSEYYKTTHHEEIVEPDAIKILPELVKHYGEPFGDSSAVPTYYLCKSASKRVKMVLSGDGGDELLAGYNTYKNWMTYNKREFSSAWKKKVYPFASAVLPSRFPPLPGINTWMDSMQYLTKQSRMGLWRKEFAALVYDDFEVFTQFEKKNWDDIDKYRYLDMKTYLPYDILTKVDAASMIHSLEVRTPLVDKKVWETVAKMPAQHVMSKSNGVWEGKSVMKKLLEKHFPKEFIYRKKMGFAIPISHWFSDNGRQRDFVKATLTEKNSRLYQFLEPDAIASVIEANDYRAIWLLLFLEEWLKNFNQNK